jgi:dCTP deaminase
MSVKSTGRLQERLFEKDPARMLVVTPILDPATQLNAGRASIDLRLGTRFTVFRRGKVGEVDTNAPAFFEMMASAQQTYYVPIGSSFVLHPDYFVLGETLEYIRLPDDLMAYVVTRSSWGRHGLVIATAIGVHPRYSGVLTLELRNLAEVPLRLYPGQRILQMFLHEMDRQPDEGIGKPSSYEGGTRVTPPLMTKDTTEMKAISLFSNWDEAPLRSASPSPP